MMGLLVVVVEGLREGGWVGGSDRGADGGEKTQQGHDWRKGVSPSSTGSVVYIVCILWHTPRNICPRNCKKGGGTFGTYKQQDIPF